ncbi:hypothetical protein VCRA2110O318_140008 [Vibrio crassostreae]|nr:hypothetical protein VCRA2110O318_140008 [Vibrio crassostreae]CAK2409602.1 hypothetical protein VCRA2110O319_130098 [Vibrio crassostreae]CAK2618977.1 hypothetical protein VCRA217O317_130024 [Vibrio crassostreae]
MGFKLLATSDVHDHAPSDALTKFTLLDTTSGLTPVEPN